MKKHPKLTKEDREQLKRMEKALLAVYARPKKRVSVVEPPEEE